MAFRLSVHSLNEWFRRPLGGIRLERSDSGAGREAWSCACGWSVDIISALSNIFSLRFYCDVDISICMDFDTIECPFSETHSFNHHPSNPPILFALPPSFLRPAPSHPPFLLLLPPLPPSSPPPPSPPSPIPCSSTTTA